MVMIRRALVIKNPSFLGPSWQTLQSCYMQGVWIYWPLTAYGWSDLPDGNEWADAFSMLCIVYLGKVVLEIIHQF